MASSMRSWQFRAVTGGLENNLSLETGPLPTPKPNQHLVRVVAAALNPVDYKVAEVRLLHRFAIPKPATPCSDFAGYIVAPAQGSSLKPGTPVFGLTGTSPFYGGSLSEYAIAPTNQVVALPEGVSLYDTAGVGIVGVTALQSIAPYVKPGSRVFINGGSGGTGVYGIQIAKALGCHVTVTCSTANVELVKSLGADEVIDYKKQDMLSSLKASSSPYDHIVDNVCNEPNLYFHAHEFTTASATYILVGGAPKWSIISFSLKGRLLPSFLGGGKIGFQTLMASISEAELNRLGAWIQDGSIKPVTDSTFKFEQAKEAFVKLKTGRAKGKILVSVGEEEK